MVPVRPITLSARPPGPRRHTGFGQLVGFTLGEVPTPVRGVGLVFVVGLLLAARQHCEPDTASRKAV